MKRNRFLKKTVSTHFQKSDVNRKLHPKQHDIGASRLTEIYGFGFKSKTVRKTSASKNSTSDFENDVFCFNGLLKDSCAKDCSLENPLLPKPFLIDLDNKNQLHSQRPLKNRSKSIFKEINEKYNLHQSRLNNNNIGYNFLTQLQPHITVRDISKYKKKIYAEIHKVHLTSVVRSKMSDSGSRKRIYTEDDKENFPLKFPILPKNMWIFQTPPNRKLTFRNPPNVDNNAMKPAVICKEQNNANTIYEMNPKIQVDLSTFHNKQEVPIDSRYMVPTIDQIDTMQEDCSTFKFSEETSNQYELEEYFLGLTCRPKKPSAINPRAAGCKRKRDIFEHQPENATSSNKCTEIDSNFAFLNNLTKTEESFTFKFTTSEHAEDSTATDFLLDIDDKGKDVLDLPFFD